MTSPPLEMCGAAALNFYADVDITGFALPAIFKDQLNSRFIMDEITKAVMIGAAAMMKIMTGPVQCIPGASAVTQTIMDAAQAAASAIIGLIPSLPSIQLLPPEKLFCKEVYKTPGFDSAQCAAELGCKYAGRGPPPGEEIPLPEQVTSTDTKTLGAV